MRYAWENGLFFTRWLPDLAFGYGYPFFIYREPVPLYAGLIPHLLGLPLPAAENLLYILTILASGWFMYLWVRDILGARAAIVSAVAYMAAPYILIDALIRGNSPESVALPLFPLLLWLGRRWLLGGTAVPFIFSVLGLATLALSHNISLLLFTPTLGLYLLAVGFIHRLDWRQLIGRLVLLFGFGLGMTFFYSGGALLEIDQVTLQQSTSTRNNDFHYNFASIDEIFGPVSAEDSALINPPLLIRLGWTASILAALGLSRLFWRKLETRERRPETKTPKSPVSNFQSQISLKEQRWHIILMGLATAVFLFLSLPPSLFLWENIPLVDFIQFPWRMVGRAALPAAFLAGVPFAGWQVGRLASGKFSRFTVYVSRLAFFAPIILLLVEAFPMLYPTVCKEEPYPTINTVHNYEHVTGLVGVDPEGSYFPRTVARRPKESVLEAAYQMSKMPQRFDTAVLPPGTVLQNLVNEPLVASVRVNSPEPFTAQYLSFAFPGWVAKVDGRTVPITPSDPVGLITFPVPAGDHTITIRWQSTPLRTALLGLSIMMLAGFVVTAFVLAGEQMSRGAREQGSTHHPSRIDLIALFLLALFLLAAKFAVIDRVETPLRRAGMPTVSYPTALQAAELRFDGYNLSQTSVPSGATFDIDMAWTAVASPTAEYQSNVWLVGPDGLTWSGKGTERPRLYEDVPSTRQWQPGQWAWDSREVQVFTGTPPGQYDIVLTLFDKATLQPLTLLDGNGGVVGPTAVIGQIEVTRPDEPAVFAPQFGMEMPIADLSFLGYNQDRDAVAPGDVVLLTLFWEKPANPPSALSVFEVQLLDEQGAEAQTWPISPVRVDYPPDEWRPGERLRGQHILRLPAGLDSGDYQFTLNGIPLGRISIEAPDRLFEQPEVENLINAIFSDSDGLPLATLIGYTVSNTSTSLSTGLQSPISLTLLWQANAEIPTSYRVFIHLVDENGSANAIIAQSDGEPANWGRPTTGWAAGEFIIDPHTLNLPASPHDDPLILRMGLYDPITSQRLFSNFTDFVELPITMR